MTTTDGQYFKALRQFLGMTQEQAADAIGCSQRLISDIERSPILGNENHDRIKKLESLVREKDPIALDRIIEDRNAIASQRFSYRPETFDALKHDVPHWAERVEVNALIEPADTYGKEFAKARMNIHFVGLCTLDSVDPLTIDCVGNPEGPGGKPSEVWVRLLNPDDIKASENASNAEEPSPPPIKFQEDPNVSRAIGKHAVSYQLSGADPAMVPEFVVQITSDHSFRLNKLDAIGFPIYPDLLVGSISVQVTFKGMRPDPHPPTVRPLLIRRYAKDAIPMFLTDPELGTARPKPNETGTYVFGPLLRPKPGYGYIISWKRLILNKENQQTDRK